MKILTWAILPLSIVSMILAIDLNSRGGGGGGTRRKISMGETTSNKVITHGKIYVEIGNNKIIFVIKT